MLTIDFENVYSCMRSSIDVRRIYFHASTSENKLVQLLIKIDPMNNPAFKGCNILSFGPLKSTGEVDTLIRIKYLHVGKVLSTVLFEAWSFLRENPEYYLIVDGSTELRTILYHQILKNNRSYLELFFKPIGIDYYVRRKRDKTYERDVNGALLPKPMFQKFDYERTKYYLYMYYALKLNEDIANMLIKTNSL
ncbi:hypothetical protein ACE38W_06880 [Chitinophaga sp. Hz27]|uniref:DUF6934 family protein n=1 Tax=Chitinophaga sp. Hz27 TaxID=3347169 RepID=UPI0035E1C545